MSWTKGRTCPNAHTQPTPVLTSAPVRSLHIEIPPGCFGHIESKSGLNVKDSVVSCGGIIDEGYTGSIAVKLYNFGRHDKIFEVGDKIAQIIIQPYLAPEMVLVDSLDQTDRGDAGFGSTGR